MAAKFRKGEVAVLLNRDGGRLFEIYRYASHGKWQEKSYWESQQKYALEAHETHLVKCKDEAHAVALVDKLKEAHEVYRAEEAEALRKRNAAQRQAVMAHNLGLEA